MEPMEPAKVSIEREELNGNHEFVLRVDGQRLGFLEYTRPDVGVMRMQPGLTVVAPADAEQARTALLRTWELPGPVYLRLGKDEHAKVRVVLPDGTELPRDGKLD